jgi:Na+-driven multidrug efflux pump
MIKNIEIFEHTPVPKAVFKFALPTVLSMIVAVFYNMADAVFVGLRNDPNQFAAVNIATPVFLFLMAAGNIFGMGGSSFISRSLGEKKLDRVKTISSFCLYAGIFTGIAGGALILFFINPILSMIGTKEETYQFAFEYLSIVALGGPLIVVSNAYTNIIRGEGAAKSSTAGMMAGTLTNVILDPIFILPSFLGIPCLDMGVKGAAIATLIGNAVTIIVYIQHITSKNSALTVNPKYFKIRDGILKGVFTIGLPASLTNILMSLSAIITNNLLASYSEVQVANQALAALMPAENIVNGITVYKSIPIAAMGVALKANMLVIFIMLGIGMGISPLIGYNYGSKNFKRMKSIIKFSILVNVITGLILTTLYFIFTKQIVNIFSKAPAVVEMSSFMIYSLMASSPILGILFVLNFSFQAMGKGAQSLFLAVSRQGIIFLPLIFILNHYIGLFGIIWAQPVVDFISVIIAIIMFSFIVKTLKKEEKALQP